jgi:hypothetical protein|tara:strand:+ start:1856 stop:2038 length:183 start_codon:yes stop_codon:yes gene_type:complete
MKDKESGRIPLSGDRKKSSYKMNVTISFPSLEIYNWIKNMPNKSGFFRDLAKQEFNAEKR